MYATLSLFVCDPVSCCGINPIAFCCRYFTTPFVLAVLHLPAPKHPTALWLVIASYCCVNVLTLWMFTQCPYTWSDGSVARFMW
jgi:hypothetical protein